MDHKLWLSESPIDAFQLLTMKRHPMPSKESDKVGFWWTSVKKKPLKIILKTFQGKRAKKLTMLPSKRRENSIKLIFELVQIEDVPYF